MSKRVTAFAAATLLWASCRAVPLNPQPAPLPSHEILSQRTLRIVAADRLMDIEGTTYVRVSFNEAEYTFSSWLPKNGGHLVRAKLSAVPQIEHYLTQHEANQLRDLLERSFNAVAGIDSTVWKASFREIEHKSDWSWLAVAHMIQRLDRIEVSHEDDGENLR